MFPDLISRTPDFERQLGACVNAMGRTTPSARSWYSSA